MLATLQKCCPSADTRRSESWIAVLVEAFGELHPHLAPPHPILVTIRDRVIGALNVIILKPCFFFLSIGPSK